MFLVDTHCHINAEYYPDGLEPVFANMQLREIAMEIPLDRILCETDSPYLAPQGFRGRPNEPCHVRQVYELLAMLKKMPLEDFAAAVRENGERIFNIGAANV